MLIPNCRGRMLLVLRHRKLLIKCPCLTPTTPLRSAYSPCSKSCPLVSLTGRQWLGPSIRMIMTKATVQIRDSGAHMILITRTTLKSRRAESSLLVAVNAALITQQNLGVRPRISTTNSVTHPALNSPLSPLLPPKSPNTPRNTPKAANMRLTTDLINNSLSFINCVTERELDLRGAYEKSRCYT
jgi:hypothetical protein